MSESDLIRSLASESLRKALRGIPTVFGQLAWVAAMRDPSTGRYMASFPASAHPEDIDRTLRASHHRLFREWISFGLAEQLSDLDDFFAMTSDQSFSYCDLVPPNVRDVERQLYLTDLELLLGLRRAQAQGGSHGSQAAMASSGKSRNFSPWRAS